MDSLLTFSALESILSSTELDNEAKVVGVALVLAFTAGLIQLLMGEQDRAWSCCLVADCTALYCAQTRLSSPRCDGQLPVVFGHVGTVACTLCMQQKANQKPPTPLAHAVQGFTTGAAIIIAMSQMKYIFGIQDVPRFNGFAGQVRLAGCVAKLCGSKYVRRCGRSGTC